MSEHDDDSPPAPPPPPGDLPANRWQPPPAPASGPLEGASAPPPGHLWDVEDEDPLGLGLGLDSPVDPSGTAATPAPDPTMEAPPFAHHTAAMSLPDVEVPLHSSPPHGDAEQSNLRVADLAGTVSSASSLTSCGHPPRHSGSDRSSTFPRPPWGTSASAATPTAPSASSGRSPPRPGGKPPAPLITIVGALGGPPWRATPPTTTSRPQAEPPPPCGTPPSRRSSPSLRAAPTVGAPARRAPYPYPPSPPGAVKTQDEAHPWPSPPPTGQCGASALPFPSPAPAPASPRGGRFPRSCSRAGSSGASAAAPPADRRTALTAHLAAAARARPPLPADRSAFRERTRALEASMDLLRARAVALSQTATALVHQRSTLLGSIQSARQAVTTTLTTSSRTQTAIAHVSSIVLAPKGPPPPT